VRLAPVKRSIRKAILHALAPPVAVLVSLLASTLTAPLAGGRALDLALHDTMYVVARFHMVAFVVGFIVCSAAVVHFSGGRTRWVWYAFGLLAIHLATGAIMSGNAPSGPRGSGEARFFVCIASPSWVGYMHLMAGALACGIASVGLARSFCACVRTGVTEEAGP
jgi:hypothetical protein